MCVIHLNVTRHFSSAHSRFFTDRIEVIPALSIIVWVTVSALNFNAVGIPAVYLIIISTHLNRYVVAMNKHKDQCG